jgi:hypothetical protein
VGGRTSNNIENGTSAARGPFPEVPSWFSEG